MSYPKMKEEKYANLGGIDVKTSLYLTDQMSFLNLKNIDFRVLGALHSFSGSTSYSVANATYPIMGIADYYAQNLALVGQTNYVFGGSPMIIAVDQHNVCEALGKTFVPVMHSIITGGVLNATSFVLANFLYGCNGVDAWVYRGSTAIQFALGKPCFPVSAASEANANSGLSGFLTFYFSMVRTDGLVGPALASTYTILVPGTTQVNLRYPLPNIKMALSGNPGGGVFAPANVSFGSFGLSGIQAWVQLNAGPIFKRTALLEVLASFVSVNFNFTASGWSQQDLPYDYQGAPIWGLGSTQGSDNAQSTGSNPNVQEYFYNQLFSAGFGGSFKSRVLFSNAGTPEVADYRNFFDVAPNDPNGVSAMKSFFTQLGIWKPSSTWALSGTGPDTFQLTQVSPIYGCISKKAVCVWNQNCWFLDKQGICDWNGANTQIISTKMQEFFDRMNLPVAAATAIMVHVKQKNEIWTCIPIDGSNFNNLIVIFDYVAKEWSTAPCPANMTEMAILSQAADAPKQFYGTYSGLIGNWGSSFINNNGSGVTHVIKTGFMNPMGNSVTKMFRRLYLDAKVPAGSTQIFAVNLYRDYQTTPYKQTTMVISSSPSQQRIDFGVPGKALSAEFFYLGDAGALQWNGMTLEYRFQRAT